MRGKSWFLCFWIEHECQEFKIGLSSIDRFKSEFLIKFWIGKIGLVFISCDYANTVSSLCFRIVDYFLQKLFSYSLSLKRARYPQAMNDEKILRLNRFPASLAWHIFHKDFPSSIQSLKYQSFGKSFFHPGFFVCSSGEIVFVVPDCTADMLLINVVRSDGDDGHGYEIY